MDVVHKDGIAWHRADIPPRLHKCWAQTEAWIDFLPVYRCACGAISDDGKLWLVDVGGRDRPLDDLDTLDPWHLTDLAARVKVRADQVVAEAAAAEAAKNPPGDAGTETADPSAPDDPWGKS